MRVAPIFCVFLALTACTQAPNSILSTDTIKTEAEAIQLGIKNCGDALRLRSNWHARLEGDTWVVCNEQDRHTYVEFRVRKSDGYDDGKCEVAFTAD